MSWRPTFVLHEGRQASGVLGVLGHPGYRRFLLGTLTASSGIWVCETALLWLIQSQTGSSAVIGLYLTVVTVPFVAGAFWGGLLTDRFGPRPLMVLATIAWAVAIAVGALMALNHQLTVTPALAIGFVLGAFDSVWTVPLQIMAPASVGRDLTSAAVGAFPLQYGFGRVIGGLGGGALIGAAGVPPALGVSCLALIVAGVILLSVRYQQEPHRDRSVEGQIPESAIAWLKGDTVAVTVLILAALTSIITFSYTALLPAIAINSLHAGAAGLGVLTAGGGVGILVLSLLTDKLGLAFGRARVILGAVAATAIGLVALAASDSLLIATLACAAAAGLLMIFISTASLVLQAWSPPGRKGRAVSVLSLVFWGALPVGAVILGIASDRIGSRNALLLCAGLSMVIVVATGLVRREFLGVNVDTTGARA